MSNTIHTRPEILSDAPDAFFSWEPQPEYATLVITPELAQEILKRSKTDNRPVSAGAVARYAEDMASGDWVVNGECLAFDFDGNLVNGHHRLLSIIKADTPVPTGVIWGVEPEVAFSTYDRGRPRNLADNLSQLNQANAVALSGVISRLYNYLHAGGNPYANRYVPIRAGIELSREYPELHDSVLVAKRTKLMEFTKHPAPKSLLACMHFVFSQRDPDLADWFFARIADGEGLSRTDGVYQLRRKLVRDASQRYKEQKMPYRVIAALIIKAWNAHRTGKEVQVLRAPRDSEAFPTVV